MTIRASSQRDQKLPISLCGILALSLISVTAAHAAEVVRKIFDIPADAAEKSLRQFSAQSGIQVIFPTEVVRGVRTQAIQGEFTTREALDRMVANTSLKIVQDEKTSALTVTRPTPEKPAPNPSDPSPSNPKTQTPEEPQKTMKNKAPIAWLGSLFALVAAVDPLSGQTVAPNTPGSVIELSPFIVTTSKDTGYQAMNTLAGTRLDVPLKDIGAAISIYTKDFLDDIGATDANDLLIYATGMEAAGPGGNWTNAMSANDFNNIVVPQADNTRANPQGQSRSRGLSSPTFTRDFFNAAITIDTYNTERVTVLRGPNAALFGVSNPGGVTDNSLIRADVRRNINRVSFRLDNNGGHRSTVDFNRVLVPNKLAVRLAGLEARDEYNQRPAYDHRERLFGTMTYTPFKHTSLRANFETGRTRANRPIGILPPNSIATEWYLNGRPGFDWAFYDDPARNPLAATQVSTNFYPAYIANMRLSGSIVRVYNNPGDRSPSYTIRAVTPTTNASVADAVRQQILHPLLNRDLAGDNFNFSATNNLFEMVATAYWTGGNVLPGQLAGQTPPGLKPQGFLDFSAFDWENRMIDESAFFMDNFHAGNVVFTQTAWDNRVGVELGYDQQRADRGTRASFFNGSNNSNVRIDTTVTLPTGLPNPNLGRPMGKIRSNTAWNNNKSEAETRRATIYLKYDFKDLNDSWGRWAGSHTLSGVREIYQRTTLGYQWREASAGNYANTLNPVLSARGVSTVVYLGPSLIGNNNPLRLNPITIGPLPTGPAGDVQYFARQANTTDAGAFTSAPYSVVHYVPSGNTSREVIKSKAATLQSYWLSDHVSTILGWRRDADYFDNNSENLVINPANPSDPGKTVWGFDDLAFPNLPAPSVSAETRSYSVVVRWPQKLLRLPKGTDFSVFYNKSENFTPVGGRVGKFGESLPPPQGKTEEYGFNVSAFNDKLTIRFNRFETAAKGSSNASQAQALIANLPLDTVIRWAPEANTNPHLQAMRNADIALLSSVLPSHYFSQYNLTISGTAPNITATRNSSLSGSTDTTDFTAEGEEVDIIYNPTPNWRILANVAHQETIRANSIPLARKLLATLEPVIATLAGRANGRYPTGWQIGDPLPATVETFGAFVDRTVRLPLAAELASEGQPSAEQRNWRVNLITNYSFSRNSMFFGDKLNGWSIGGGIRWQDKMVMGYRSSRLADGTPVFDQANPLYAPSEMDIDGFVGYGRKIWNDRIDWKVQLNVRNIYQKRELIPIAAQPWGQSAAVRLAPEQRWYLNNTFSF